MIKHYITKYTDCNTNKMFAESWLQVNLLGKCFCFNKKKVLLN